MARRTLGGLGMYVQGISSDMKRSPLSHKLENSLYHCDCLLKKGLRLSIVATVSKLDGS